MKIGFELDGLISTPLKSITDLSDIANQTVLDGAKGVLLELKRQGHQIVIYTKRDVSVALDTERWLDTNKIPYDQILFNRPVSITLFFSENSRRFTTWDSVVSELRDIGVWKDPILPTDENITAESSANLTGGVQKLKNDI